MVALGLPVGITWTARREKRREAAYSGSIISVPDDPQTCLIQPR